MFWQRLKRCVVCGGALRYLGFLGQYEWFRCEDCGIDDYDDSYPDDFVEDTVY